MAGPVQNDRIIFTELNSLAGQSLGLTGFLWRSVIQPDAFRWI
jgi:hypothetical protein